MSHRRPYVRSLMAQNVQSESFVMGSVLDPLGTDFQGVLAPFWMIL